MYEHIRELAEARCARIAAKRYELDPGLSHAASKASSVIRALHAGEADIIAATVAAVLRDVPHFKVLEQHPVTLPDQAFKLIRSDKTPVGVRVRSDAAGDQRVIDLIVVDTRTQTIAFYEIKRGSDHLNSEQKRQRRRTDAVLRVIGVDYARRELGLPARRAEAAVISYYGRTGLPPADTITGDALDATFGVPIQAAVEDHVQHFRRICEDAVPGTTVLAA
jgi:hypothetical protein